MAFAERMCMVWSDPAALTNEEIEAALNDLALKVNEARKAGSKLAELESRQWRLQAEQKFRQRRKQ
jgi:hypothetical protein